MLRKTPTTCISLVLLYTTPEVSSPETKGALLFVAEVGPSSLSDSVLHMRYTTATRNSINAPPILAMPTVTSGSSLVSLRLTMAGEEVNLSMSGKRGLASASVGVGNGVKFNGDNVGKGVGTAPRVGKGVGIGPVLLETPQGFEW